MGRMVMLRLSPTQAVSYRLAVNNLSSRLSAGSYVEAAYAGLQDTAPRDALVGMHARVEACEPSAWQDSRLIQTYSPRWAVYVLPADDFGIFTVGRLPRDPQARQVLEDLAGSRSGGPRVLCTCGNMNARRSIWRRPGSSCAGATCTRSAPRHRPRSPGGPGCQRVRLGRPST